jgi:cytoskeletal protein CcmA (bactofilin family)
MSPASSTATAASTLPPVSAPPSKAGAVRDSGTVRRDSLRAATWVTNGLVKVQGDVDVGSGTTSGLVSVGGKLSAGTFRSRGTLEVVGPTNVREQLTLDGSTHLQSAVHAGAVEANGSFRCPADVRVDRALSVTGTFEASSAHVGVFTLTGSAEIPGDLEAAVLVRGRFRGDSHLGTIRARSVVLEGPPTALIPTLWRKVFGGSASVEVGRIEADSVDLRAVDVEFVRSPQIILGPGAHVTTVEGTIVRQHPTSRIGPESRSPRPHGLSR